MKRGFNSLKAVNFSLEILLELEYVFEHKIKMFDENTQGTTESFSSLVKTMKEEQKEELRVLQNIILIITRLKQEFCKHPKKDHDICKGIKYCMNCNLTLKNNIIP